MTVSIVFTNDQLAVLNEGLITLPYRIAAPLIAHINGEIQRGFDAREDMAASEPKVPSPPKRTRTRKQ